MNQTSTSNRPSFRRGTALLGSLLALPLFLANPAPVAAQSQKYGTEDALDGLKFNQPLGIVSAPGEKHRLFIVEKTGRIQVVTNLDSKPVKSEFLDVRERPDGKIELENECGLLGLAFPPDFAKSKRFYVYYSLKINGQLNQRVSRFEVSASDPNKADATKEQPLWSQPDRAVNHNAGDLHFGPDGYLYVSTGDGGAGGDQLNHARFITKGFHSAFLRMDVNKKMGNLEPNPAPGIPVDSAGKAYYSVPADNPFVNATSYNGETVDPKTVRTEIWATGFRNPWRFSFDSKGRLFTGDVGDGGVEEIDIVTKGGNYGWSFREGTRNFGNKRPGEGVKFIEPIYEYPRPAGVSVTGGVVYRGTAFPDLKDAYLFADFISGNIVALRDKGGKWEAENIGREGNIAGIGFDPRNNEVLFACLGPGVIKRLKK